MKEKGTDKKYVEPKIDSIKLDKESQLLSCLKAAEDDAKCIDFVTGLPILKS